MQDKAQAMPLRKPRRKEVVAARVVKELKLDRKLAGGRVGRLEGVTVLNPGVALLNRMRNRQVVRAQGKQRPRLKGA